MIWHGLMGYECVQHQYWIMVWECGFCDPNGCSWDYEWEAYSYA